MLGDIYAWLNRGQESDTEYQSNQTKNCKWHSAMITPGNIGVYNFSENIQQIQVTRLQKSSLK